MIAILSPSKSMTMEPVAGCDFSQPAYLAKSELLISKLRRVSKADLMQLMAISEALAKLNQQRYKTWSTPFTTVNAKQALFVFTGDVYEGLDAHCSAFLDVVGSDTA